MHPLFIFALIVGPLAALLLWVLVCEIKGVPAFTDGPPPGKDELDTIGRWILGGACVGVATLAYAYGGVYGVLAMLSLVAILATLSAITWTVAQGVRQWLRRRQADRLGTDIPHPLAPLHLRFARNFRRSIVQVPLFLASLG